MAANFHNRKIVSYNFFQIFEGKNVFSKLILDYSPIYKKYFLVVSSSKREYKEEEEGNSFKKITKQEDVPHFMQSLISFIIFYPKRVARHSSKQDSRSTVRA
ncbi:MAG: hypothetical protein EAX96_18485 [Candidatus Lokiarchaeota archaeon]|nr:hypothetical protein [Candidatus Lokiarchaeota archaeon]